MTNSLTVVAKVFSKNKNKKKKKKNIDICAAKVWVAFAMKKLLTFFQQQLFNVYATFQDRNYNVTLANNFVKFWKTGPR